MSSKAVSAVTDGPSGPALDGQRSVEESVGFGLGHRLRIEILAALHEGPASAAQLATMLQQPRHRLRYHLEELLKDGSVEIARQEPAGNMTVNFYRVTRLAFYSEADWRGMAMGERQVTSALILQASWAEALASLWAGKFHSDPEVTVIWNRIRLDPEGRSQLHAEQGRSWERIAEIEASAANRRAASKAPGDRFVVTSLGFERGRISAPAPQPLESGICEDAPPGLSHSANSGRTVEEAVSHSIGHRIRVEVLAALHEGPATASALARMIGQPLSLLDYHVRQLVEDGAIRVTATRRIRNLSQPVYDVIKLPFYDETSWRRLTREDRQVFSAISLRAAMAESLASLWAGKFHSDPLVMVAWNRIVLDQRGRRDLAEEQQRSWKRICCIEVDAARRLRGSGKDGKMYVVTLLGYERGRSTAPEPLTHP
jgi:DNA-binding transcriptional ArsR family regulator